MQIEKSLALSANILMALRSLQHDISENVFDIGEIDDSKLVPIDAFYCQVSSFLSHITCGLSVADVPKHIHASQFGLYGYLLATSFDGSRLLDVSTRSATSLGYCSQCEHMSGESRSNLLKVDLGTFNQSDDNRFYILLIAIWIRLFELALGTLTNVKFGVNESIYQALKSSWGDCVYKTHKNIEQFQVELQGNLKTFLVPGRNERLHGIFLNELCEIERERCGESRLSASVYRYILSLSDFKQLSSQKVASHFLISDRTLHRKLSLEETSYKHILQTVRGKKSITLLLQGECIEKIADNLGFSSRSSFERSFKSWQGVTPAHLQASYALLGKTVPNSQLTNPAKIPNLPSNSIKLMNALNASDVDFDSVASIISKDASLSAKILWMANSSLYGNLKINSVKHAILSVFGLKKLSALVVQLCSVDVFHFDENTFDMDEYYFCSVTTAQIIEILCQSFPPSHWQGGDLYFAGLLSNLGQLYLRYCLPEQYISIMEESNLSMTWSQLNAMQSIRLGLNAKQCSSLLATAWNLPENVKQILIALSKKSTKDPHISALSLMNDFVFSTWCNAKSNKENARNAKVFLMKLSKLFNTFEKSNELKEIVVITESRAQHLTKQNT